MQVHLTEQDLTVIWRDIYTHTAYDHGHRTAADHADHYIASLRADMKAAQAPGHTDLMVSPEAVGDLPDTAPGTLPYLVAWEDLRPGDLALAPGESYVWLWRQERGSHGTWRHAEGTCREEQGPRSWAASETAILLARGVRKSAKAIRAAFEAVKDVALPLAEKVRSGEVRMVRT